MTRCRSCARPCPSRGTTPPSLRRWTRRPRSSTSGAEIFRIRQSSGRLLTQQDEVGKALLTVFLSYRSYAVVSKDELILYIEPQRQTQKVKEHLNSQVRKLLSSCFTKLRNFTPKGLSRERERISNACLGSHRGMQLLYTTYYPGEIA